MWRSLTIALLLFVLAQTANALPITNFNENVPVFPTTQQVETGFTPTSTLFTLLVEQSEPEDAFSLPRINQACASVFANEIQTTANYILIFEFFELKLSAGLFKNLANPPLQLSWFEQLSHQSNSNRLSGWKDSNTIYTSRISYQH